MSESFIGEDSLDLNDSVAVAEWTRKKLEEHEAKEQAFRQKMKAHGVDHTELNDEEPDLSSLDDTLQGELKDMLADYERRESAFLTKMNQTKTRARGVPRGIPKWKQL